jgi:hypothetical protein
MRPRSKFRVIAPREPKAVKPRKPKTSPRFIEHARYGLGRVLAVRQIDGSDDGYMADVKFADGTTRTLLLMQRVWISDIAGLIPAAAEAASCTDQGRACGRS